MPDATNPTRRTRPTFRSLAAHLSGQGDPTLDMRLVSAASPQREVNAADEPPDATADKPTDATADKPTDATADTPSDATADTPPDRTAERLTNTAFGSLSIAGVKLARSGIVVPTVEISLQEDKNGVYISPETSAEIQAKVLFPMHFPIDFLHNS
jgi:hypothetical protein